MRWAGHVAYIGERKGAYTDLVGKLREKDHFEDPGLDGRLMLTWVFRKWDGRGMDWIDLDQDRDRWRALVNEVMNFRVP